MLKPVVTLLALALTACATQLGVRDDGDLRRQMFSQVVFAPDYDSRRSDFLAKWTVPLRIKLRDQNTESIGKYTSTVKKQTEALVKMSGLDIKVVSESSPANVIIQFDTLGGMQKLATSNTGNAAAAKASISAAGCHAEIVKNTGHTITAARIFVVVNPDAKSVQLLSGSYNTAEAKNEKTRVTQCLVKGLIQILGFVNPSDVITPSIFNSVRNLSQPTSLDLKIIKALYDSSLKPGMPRREALQVAEKLLQ